MIDTNLSISNRLNILFENTLEVFEKDVVPITKKSNYLEAGFKYFICQLILIVIRK